MQKTIVTIIIILCLSMIWWSCKDKVTKSDDDPPRITSLTANPANLDWGDTSQLIVVANDPEGESLGYDWECTVGSFTTPTDNDTITWQAPMSTADCDITVEVDDGENISRQSTTLHVTAHPVMDVDEDILNFGTETTSLTFNVINTGTGALTWEIDTSTFPNWLAVDPDDGSTTTQTQVTVTVDRTGQAPGTYTAQIRVVPTNESLTKALAAGFGEMTVAVNMTVPLPPSLQVSPASLDFGSNTTSLNFNIQNTGGGTLTWSITDNAGWLTVNPTSGTTTTETDQITASVNRTGLAQGVYTAVISVTSDYGNSTVNVQMTVDPPALNVSRTFLDYGTTTTSLTFNITNTGSGTLNWSIVDDAGWLTVNPTNGTTSTETDQVTATVDRTGLTEGTYTAQIAITSNGGNATINVQMEVTDGGGVGQWIKYDDENYESYWDAQPTDYFFMVLFDRPTGWQTLRVTKVRIKFNTNGSDDIRLLGMDSRYSQERWWPNDVIYQEPEAETSTIDPNDGWNVWDVDWLFGAERFFIGYFQLQTSNYPRVYEDTSDPDWRSYRLYEVGGSFWWTAYGSRDWAIQVYVVQSSSPAALAGQPQGMWLDGRVNFAPRSGAGISRGENQLSIPLENAEGIKSLKVR